MDLSIQFTANDPKYEAIYKQMIQQIKKKQLRPHTPIPPKRVLAEQLQVSVHTVQTAYEQLISEGYLYTTERQGYFVSELDLPDINEHDFEKLALLDEQSSPFINFRNGQVDTEALPYKKMIKFWRESIQAEHIPNAPWQGEPMLRNEIATYLRRAKGLHCQPHEIFIFSGTQAQLHALSIFFGRPRVAIENPGFHRAFHVFQQLEMPIERIQVDEHGCTVPTKSVKLLYTTPAHQFPLGSIMPVARKLALLKWAEKMNSYILEDSYDSEFRFKGSPIPPLAQLDQQERVIYFGSFSKTLLPSIRMSYIVLPRHLVAPFEQFFALQKSTVSKIEQIVVAKMIASGEFEKNVAKMRVLYKEKRQFIIREIQKHLGEDFVISGEDAGLHIVLSLPSYLPEEIAVTKAKEAGVMVDSMAQFYQEEKGINAVVIGYSAPSLEEIRKGVQLLAKAWAKT